MIRNALIVDKDVEFVELFSIALESVGFKIATVANSIEALIYLQNNQVDLLALDIDRLENGGLEILRVIRSIPQSSRLRIAILTADPLMRLHRDSRLADIVMPKPLTFRQLLMLAPRILDLCRTAVH